MPQKKWADELRPGDIITHRYFLGDLGEASKPVGVLVDRVRTIEGYVYVIGETVKGKFKSLNFHKGEVVETVSTWDDSPL
jgi:hypothetical protein